MFCTRLYQTRPLTRVNLLQCDWSSNNCSWILCCDVGESQGRKDVHRQWGAEFWIIQQKDPSVAKHRIECPVQ
jgi:hypothetical protein